MICPYCDFFKLKEDSESESLFLKALLSECDAYKKWDPSLKIKSIYFGGGTPNCLSIDTISRILDYLRSTFDCSQIIETSMEINPDTIHPSYFNSLLQLGITRISLGIQSSLTDELLFLGRTHTFKDVRKVVDMFQSKHFLNYSFDLMFGLPQSNLDTITEVINDYLSLNPAHISTYSLTISKGTPFEKQGVTPLKEVFETSQFEVIIHALQEAGYIHYELMSFALSDAYKCFHNIHYWTFEPYIGLGPSACSFFKSKVFRQTSDMKNYLTHPMLSIEDKYTNTRYTKEMEKKDFIIANFRLVQGLSLNAYYQRFNVSFINEFDSIIRVLNDLGLAKVNRYHVQLTQKGQLLYDSVIDYFI